MRINEIQDKNNEIHNYKKLDRYLVKLCKLLIDNKKLNNGSGMVAAGVMTYEHPFVGSTNYHLDGKVVHAEHAAIDAYEKKYGKITEGAIILTTLSPCNEHDDTTAHERMGMPCAELIDSKGIKKVYCGYLDPTQAKGKHDHRHYNLIETENPSIRELCEMFADTFLKTNKFENFADGKGPGRPGDSQRHGIPKHATIAQLQKAAKAPGRKGQLARWQINMRRGKKK